MTKLPIISTFVFAVLTAGANAALAGERQILGLIETVRFHAAGLLIEAKVDTGSGGTSVGVSDILHFEREGIPWVRFSVGNRNGQKQTFERPVLRTAKIRRAGTAVVRRPVVPLELCIGNTLKTIDVNLSRRDGMNYKMLVGRNFLNGTHMVDPAAHHLTQPACPAPVATSQPNQIDENHEAGDV
jgi:hypothetical protein